MLVLPLVDASSLLAVQGKQPVVLVVGTLGCVEQGSLKESYFGNVDIEDYGVHIYY